MIDHPDKDFKASELPAICNDKTIDQIKESVINLNALARVLKQQRLETGSLRLDQMKLKFVLSPDTGLPLAVGHDEASIDTKRVFGRLSTDFFSAKTRISLLRSLCCSQTSVSPSTFSSIFPNNRYSVAIHRPKPKRCVML